MKTAPKQLHLQSERFKNGAFTSTPNGTLVNKIDQYNWKLKDAPGEFRMIDKGDLFIAPEYQRDAKSIVVMDIAREWSWISCGCLIVCLRDGKYWVIDGQHRKLGADKRSDIKKLPCLVYQGGTIQNEAQAFKDSNLRRSRPNALAMYRASVTAKDEIALFISGVLESAGLRVSVSGSPKSVACIGTLLKLAKQSREKFTRMWPLFTHMHQDTEMFGDVLQGLWQAENMIGQNGKTLLQDPNFSKLIRIGGRACLGEIKRLSIERGKGGQAVFRDAILSVLRKKI